MNDIDTSSAMPIFICEHYEIKERIKRFFANHSGPFIGRNL